MTNNNNFSNAVWIHRINEKKYKTEKEIRKVEASIMNDIKISEMNDRTSYVYDNDTFIFANLVIHAEKREKTYIWEQVEIVEDKPKSNIMLPS